MSEGTPPPPPPENPYGGAAPPPPGGQPPPPPPGAPEPPPPARSAPPPAPAPHPVSPAGTALRRRLRRATGAGGYDAVEAIKYGWAKFTKNVRSVPDRRPDRRRPSASCSASLVQFIAAAIFDTTPETTVDPTTGAVRDRVRPDFFTSLLGNAWSPFVGQRDHHHRCRRTCSKMASTSPTARRPPWARCSRAGTRRRWSVATILVGDRHVHRHPPVLPPRHHHRLPRRSRPFFVVDQEHGSRSTRSRRASTS